MGRRRPKSLGKHSKHSDGVLLELGVLEARAKLVAILKHTRELAGCIIEPAKESR